MYYSYFNNPIEMTAREKAQARQKVMTALQELSEGENGWVRLTDLGARLRKPEFDLDCKQYGYRLKPFLDQFSDVLEFRDEPTEGSSHVWLVRRKNRGESGQTFSESGFGGETAQEKPIASKPKALKRDEREAVRAVFQNAPNAAPGKVLLAVFGNRLIEAGVDYKQRGGLRDFLRAYPEFEVVREKPEGSAAEVDLVRMRTVPDYGTGAAITPRNVGRRPPYREGEAALKALGYVENAETVAERFSRSACVRIGQDELEENMKRSYDRGDILYYEYDENGNPKVCSGFTGRTAAFAVDSRVRNPEGEEIYVYYKKSRQKWSGVRFLTRKGVYNETNAYRIGRLSFRNYEEANRFIRDLEEELLPGETWKYGEPSRNTQRKKTEFEILESYLAAVLDALFRGYEDPKSLNYEKIKLSNDGRYALFNTGLLSKYASDVILVGEKFPVNGRLSFISNPAILRRGKTELQEKRFDAADGDVDMVSFYRTQPRYDAAIPVDTTDLTKLRHCIVDGIKKNRFPQNCRALYDSGNLETLTDMFIRAIGRAERIARRNYTYVVPQYRVETGEIQFLMPIYMNTNYDKAPDFALVLSEQTIGDEKFHRPETVLTLAQAYNNARVICQWGTMWLKPESIEDNDDTMDGDEAEDFEIG